MRSYQFAVFEHDPARTWVILDSARHTVELEDGVVFFDWAQTRRRQARFTFQLDAWGGSASAPPFGAER